MLLRYLIEDINLDTEKDIIGNIDIAINKIEYDSSKIGESDVFVAIEGFKTDGHEYIAEAVRNGATGIVVNKEEVEYVKEICRNLPQEVCIIVTEDTRKILSHIACRYYDNPSSKLSVIGITGTKGKTTTAYMIRDILKQSGKKVGLIGTIYNEYADVKEEATRTTPESLDLQRMLSDMASKEIQYVVMEVSSHALSLHRVDGIHFDIGVFTNLSEEHLDFHCTMDEYLKAKAKLFENCAFSIINADDLYTPKLLKLIDGKIAKFGLDNKAEVTATEVRVNNDYVDFKMYINRQPQVIKVAIPGRYTVYNALAAITVTSMLNAQMQDILVALSNVKVPGRSEVVDINKSFAVIVDYAHTPSSLEAILVNTKKYVKGRVICVFGCGGNRDTLKRAEMGRIAGQYANFTVITTDNPRDEKPEDIAKEIESGIKETRGLHKVILNRKEAIKFAMRIAWKNDTVIIAGKGHETYQELAGGKKVPFDDREIVKAIAATMPEKDNVDANM